MRFGIGRCIFTCQFLRIDMDKTTNSKKNKRKFKQTQQLLKLASNEGWSQVEIAKKCRTQQSVVSGWLRGTAQGTEQQLKPLLDIFGHKLRRNSFRVYWSMNREAKEKTFYKVEGRVILSHVFNDKRRSNYRKPVNIPLQKLVIHHQGGNKFRLVHQSRLISAKTNEEIESPVEGAIWNAHISEQVELTELLRIVDNFAEKQLTDHPNDAITLPYTARQALLNNGFNIDGVVEYPAIW